MNKSKKTITVLIIGLVGLLFSPLISSDYPAQAAIQKEERQGFSIKSFLAQAESAVSESVDEDKTVLHPLTIFLSNINAAYETNILTQDDVKRVVDALLFTTVKNKVKQVSTIVERNLLAQSIDTANLVMNVSDDYSVDAIIGALLLEGIERDDIKLSEVKSRYGLDIEKLLASAIDRTFTSEKATEISLASELASLGVILANAPDNWTPEKKEAYMLWMQEVVDKVPENSSPELKKAINQKIKQYFDAE